MQKQRSLRELGLVKTADAPPTTAQQYNALAVNLRNKFNVPYNGGSGGNEGLEKYRTLTMQHESGGNQYAVNKQTGAMGLYQFMPNTLRGLGFDGDFKQFLASKDLQNQYFDKFTQQNAKALNIDVGNLDAASARTLAWAHFGGVKGAQKMLSGNMNYGNTNFYGASPMQYGNYVYKGFNS